MVAPKWEDTTPIADSPPAWEDSSPVEVNKTAPRNLASDAADVLTKEDDFKLSDTPVGMVQQVADATKEAFIPTREGLKRFFDPTAGKYSVSRILEALGRKTGKAVRSSAANTADKMAASKMGQENPQVTAATGAIYSTIADILSDSLTPSAAQQQVGGDFAGAVVKPMAAAMTKKAGKVGAKVGQMMTGVKSQEFERLAKDPGALFTAMSKENAGNVMDAVLAQEGINTTPSSAELFDPQLSHAREVAAGVFEKMQKQEPISAQELLAARRATDRIIAGTGYKDKAALAKLMEVRGQFNSMLGEMSPATAEASRNYARAATAANFRRVLPVTASGEPSVARSVVQPMIAAASGLGAGIPAAVGLLAASSPIVAGLVTSLSSMGTEAAGRILGTPAIRRLLVSEYQKYARDERTAGSDE